MRSTRRRRRMSAIDQINVTPLLDLTFLLLIVFMISMPLMEYRTSISPPEMNSEKLPEENFQGITLTRTGTIMLGKEPVTREELTAALSRLRDSAPKTQLLLRADGARSYNDVIELMALIRHTGFHDVSLVTQAEGK
ncbi:Biopolymer transport protein ExbD [bioreactor metagenome]|uniref:Biopolymer transport protein ExbD n=1 Tax=bioreactor metagenome TaxID=1076179 RepID=A0A645BR71_9ZZZZ